ncbi:MAG: tripartite tricarboxylate transporter substrate-binding protein [Burkholderiales bacterium]
MAAVLVSAFAWPVAQAQPMQYPARPLRLVVPFTPGGGADISARQIAAKLSERLGQQVVVDNRGGGGGLIGMKITADAAADGYTLLFTSASYGAAIAARKSASAWLKGLTPVLQVGTSHYAIAAYPSLPGNLKDFLDLARAKPGQLSYASSGVGGLNHLAAELLLHMSKVKMLHVPYKGVGPAMTDLFVGRTSMLMTTPISLLPHFRSGKLRALAVTGATRMPELPDVPIAADTVPGYVVNSWYAVLVPGGTPRTVVDTLNAALNKVVNQRDLKKNFQSLGIDITGGTPERLAEVVHDDYQRWSTVVKNAGITLD